MYWGNHLNIQVMRKLRGESGPIPSSAGLTPKLWHHGRSEPSLVSHLQGWVFHRLSQQPLPVPFPSHNGFSNPTRNSLAQVVSAALYSPVISGESVSFTLLQAGAGSKKLPSCRCLWGWCRICPSAPGLCCTAGDAPWCQLWLPAAVTCHQSEAAAHPVTNQPCPQQCHSHSCQCHPVADYSYTLMVQPVFHSSSKSTHPSQLGSSPVWL